MNGASIVTGTLNATEITALPMRLVTVQGENDMGATIQTKLNNCLNSVHLRGKLLYDGDGDLKNFKDFLDETDKLFGELYEDLRLIEKERNAKLHTLQQVLINISDLADSFR